MPLYLYIYTYISISISIYIYLYICIYIPLGETSYIFISVPVDGILCPPGSLVVQPSFQFAGSSQLENSSPRDPKNGGKLFFIIKKYIYIYLYVHVYVYLYTYIYICGETSSPSWFAVKELNLNFLKTAYMYIHTTSRVFLNSDYGS